MKSEYCIEGIQKLCGLFGKTRHAYYDNLWRSERNTLKDDLVLHMIYKIRESLPRIGTRKLHYMINKNLAEHKLEAGRDYLFHLLSDYKLLIRNRRRNAKVTNSRHWMRKYSNLILGLEITRPDQLWVSDITYISMPNGFAYLSLVTDAYSHKIVGYYLCRNLEVEGCLIALEMALHGRLLPYQSLIHHSDRGSQYCCKQYVDLLSSSKIAISMTNNGDPYENAIAERVNGIIKGEFNLYSSQLRLEELSKKIDKTIDVYNHLRPHDSCDLLTPQEAHQKTGPLKKRWKNYKKKYVINP